MFDLDYLRVDLKKSTNCKCYHRSEVDGVCLRGVLFILHLMHHERHNHQRNEAEHHEWQKIVDYEVAS